MFACGGAPTAGSSGENGKPSFGQIKPILQSKCWSCHPAGGTERKPLSTLAEVKLVRYASLYRLEASDSTVMPKGDPEFKNSEEGKKLIRWFREGLEVNPLVETAEDYAKLTYDDVKGALATACGTCHSADVASGGVVLATLEDVRTQRSASISAIEAKRMPQGGGEAFVKSIDGKRILGWLKSGGDVTQP